MMIRDGNHFIRMERDGRYIWLLVDGWWFYELESLRGKSIAPVRIPVPQNFKWVEPERRKIDINSIRETEYFVWYPIRCYDKSILLARRYTGHLRQRIEKYYSNKLGARIKISDTRIDMIMDKIKQFQGSNRFYIGYTTVDGSLPQAIYGIDKDLECGNDEWLEEND